ncbi:polysaccharide deacetylase family protein [Nonomuraea phyllanthi]|uniref:Polysaccharide deacetylase family protein n=1 Tax=Nonomuraea phyllanthi TaxID=2219224 RepID=A0A5C4WC33_9ACTN|nr:polysaccharide deacetylase family protein [Nonomuraea phyllanthi]KAB8193069.1 polysaccharide deacetylase family protein [Nonomuraea phyllanthi]QFY11069.1 polysaccharide deacetylase family protein [Nonomuraea phyllanthi]
MRLRTLPLGLAGLALLHAGPAATWLPRVRRRLPGLAGVGHPGHVAITFDDGPHPGSTPRFLDELARLRCHATFFVLGELLERHQPLGRRIVAEGHELAVHGWRHGNALLAPPGRVAAELGRAADLVEQVAGVRPAWYRPPYGALSLEALVAARLRGLRPVLWTDWGRDWEETATPDSVLATVTAGLRGGATVLLHDSDHVSVPGSWRPALDALPALVGHCRLMGLWVGPLRDHGVAGATHISGESSDIGLPFYRRIQTPISTPAGNGAAR